MLFAPLSLTCLPQHPAEAGFILPLQQLWVCGRRLEKGACGVLNCEGAGLRVLPWGRGRLKYPDSLVWVKLRNTGEPGFIPALSIVDFKKASKAGYGLFKRKKERTKGEWRY